ncbi:hypothetical protein FA95DRAFT_505361 [Auriscalpium vulgare]|uniref:Uncharacterized protein n=1 Tax=Auriscalpium vulgare TaxID=40419 RepID=A0ACB8RGC7_9AGAM|nr:hypothetical protein FA95DRAFT_505361 [Auriscalpium vulgare]
MVSSPDRRRRRQRRWWALVATAREQRRGPLCVGTRTFMAPSAASLHYRPYASAYVACAHAPPLLLLARPSLDVALAALARRPSALPVGRRDASHSRQLPPARMAADALRVVLGGGLDRSHQRSTHRALLFSTSLIPAFDRPRPLRNARRPSNASSARPCVGRPLACTPICAWSRPRLSSPAELPCPALAAL